MALMITLSRPLLLPEIEFAGRRAKFHPVTETSNIPDGTQVHCTTSLDPLLADAIAAMPESIRLIANIGVGIDNIDLEAATARGIAVSNTPVVTEDTADLAFALILAACRRVGEGERFLRGGNWTAAGVAPPLGMRVHGKVLGLVGFGAIAQAVARRARGFDMEVRYWNRTRRENAEAATEAVFEPNLDRLVAGAHVVSIHTVLTSETRDLIDADRLNQFRKGAVLINTARGGIVDEDAVVKALQVGRLSAAGLDVFAGEPRVYPALLSRDDVVLTPHIGSATDECRTDMVRRALGNIAAYFEHGQPVDRVDQDIV